MRQVTTLLAVVLLASTANATKPKVVIPDFTTPGIEAAAGKALGENLVNIVAAEVQRLGYDVISWADIKAMLAVEKRRAILGCEDDVLCMAEIGGALGGDYLISGTVGKLGETFNLSLVLVDTKRAQVKQRFQGSAGSAAVLSATAKRGVQVLFGETQDLTGLGTIFIKTEPPGAEVMLDGKPVGSSPVTVDEVSAGEHLIVAQKGEHRAQTTVHLRPEALERVVLTLAEAPPVKLKVFSTPPEARVYIDDEEVGVTPLVLPSVRSGKCRIRLVLHQYRDHEDEVSLSYEEYEAGGRAPLKYEVELVPFVVGLTITGLPDEADVLIDGVRKEAPYRVAPGQRKLAIKAHGYEPFERLVAVAPGEDATVGVEMTMLPAYATYVDELDSKQLWFLISAIAGGVFAAGGAAMLVWGQWTYEEAKTARRAYDDAEPHDLADVDRMVTDYSRGARLTGDANVYQAIGFGLAGAAALSFAFCIYSRATYPDDPTTSTGVVGQVVASPDRILVGIGGSF